MDQNNNNQNPGNQVPDHRFQELQQQLRQMEAQNNQLRGMIDQLSTAQRQPTQQQETSPFEENVDRALQSRIKQLLDPQINQFKNQLGMVYDENDALKFSLRYGHDTYEKYQDKIERLRSERQRMGQYVSREDAYKHIYFEETNRKPQAKPMPAQEPAKPIYDPYTNQTINPEPTDQYQMAPPPQQAPQQQQAVPQQTQEFIAPVLPPAGVNQSGQSAAGTRAAPLNVSIEAPSQELDAWANKYGDIPL